MSGENQSSRLIVLSLPSKLSTEELTAHFKSLELPITDAKVLFKPDGQSRRLGFVGFSNAEHARQAKDWFDGTWLHGARIKVDYAKEITDTPPPRKRQRRGDPAEGHRADVAHTMTETALIAAEPPTAIPSNAHADGESGHLPDQAGLESLSDADYLAMRSKRLVGQLPQLAAGGSTVRDAPGTTAEDGDMTADSADFDNSMPRRAAPDGLRDIRGQILATGRLFLRNLPFDLLEADLRADFSHFGALLESRLPKAADGAARGLGYVTFVDPNAAIQAHERYDSKAYRGRILRVLPAVVQQDQQPALADGTASGKAMSFKTAKHRARANDAGSGFNWSTLYMNSNAVLDSVAARFGIAKAELLDAQSSSAGARLALAETHLIQETKDFFSSHGVDLASFDAGKGRSQTTLLIKNLPHETRTATIRSLITPYGVPERLLVTPSGTLALVELANADEASKAFKGLSYSRLGTSILYLEKAPLGVWQAEGARSDMYDEENADAKPSASGPDASASGQHASIPSSNDVSLFIKNFPFETTSQALREAFQHLPGYQSASVASGQGDRARQTRSAGYGFVYFDTDRSAELARIAMDGSLLGDRPIQVTHARRQTSDTLDGDTNGGGGSAAPSIGTARLIIKNLPFETSRKDLQQLLSVYGTIQALRLPRKQGNALRGFAFVQYASEKQALAAKAGLKHTHYLGRHLIVDSTV